MTLTFPRVGFCVIPIRQLAGQVYVTAQCALPTNMLNERVYMFLWFWILLTAVLTAFSIPTWFMRMAYQKSRTVFVRRFLRLSERCSPKDRLMVEKFCRQFLRHDGIFLLRMISLNAGDIICGDIVKQLWAIYRKKKYFNRDFNVAEGDEMEAQLKEGMKGEHTTIQLEPLSPNQASVGPRPSAPPKPLDFGSGEGGYYDDEEDEIVALKKQHL